MDTFDYQRSSVPARMPSQRTAPQVPQRYEGQSQENLPSPISIRAALRGARRYWWLILALWTVGSAGIGAAVYLKVKPLYQAMSVLRVDPTVIDLYGGMSREGAEPYMQTHVELIKISNVLDDAAHNPKVMALPRIQNAADAVQELSSAIQVGIRGGTYLIQVSMVSTSAEEAATIVEAVVDAFINLNRGWSSGSLETQITKLTDYAKKLEVEEVRLKKELRALQARSGLQPRVIEQRQKDQKEGKDDDNTKSTPWDVSHYHRMLAQASEVKVELMTAEANLEKAQHYAQQAANEAALISDKPQANMQVQRRLSTDTELSTLKDEQRAAFDRFQKISEMTRHTNDPAEVQARKKYEELARRFNLVQRRKKEQFTQELASGSGVQSPEIEVAKAARLVDDLRIKKNALETTLSTIKLENSKQQSDELDMFFLSEERQANKGMWESVHKKLEQLHFEAEAEERIRVVTKARVEGSPISDKRFRYLAMAPIGVLGAVLGLVFLLEIRSGRVADTDVLSSRMRHEVFAIAPLPSGRPGLGVEGDRAEQRLARFVQSLDHLRVALCEGGASGEGRCVMITSATGGEGKTTLSAHLAARCANAGTSTLLIDADLRRASLGRLLDVTPGMGLGDLLAGQTELDDSLISLQAGGFHFLSAGTSGIDPTRVLKSTRLAELIGQLRQMYDLIIIDTPPVLPVADALILGRWADGAVMAARYDASRLPLVERANRQIIAAGIPVLGVVVNGVKGQDQAYGNYAYNYNYPGRPVPATEVGDAT